MQTNTSVPLAGNVAAPPLRSSKIKHCLECDMPLCNVCAVCHTPSCCFIDLGVFDSKTAMKYKHLRTRTQKAKGFVALAHRGLNVPNPYFIVLEDSDIEEVVKAAVGKGIHRLFVRPCPVRARHGFEESRIVEFKSGGILTYDERLANFAAQIRHIFNAANEADEEHAAELLLLPFVDAMYNVIITPSRMAVGPNHDGATAGYESISIPLVGSGFNEDSANALTTRAGIKPDEDPYVEVVLTNEVTRPFFTQIRSGVRIPSAVGADYVPHPVRVTAVIDAEGDLLEWEKQVKTISPGTVVVKLGGTLISHYGVHCLYNKVPCFTSRRPSIGEVLEAVSVTPTPDPQSVIRGLGCGAVIPLELKGLTKSSDVLKIDAALISMMTTLHNAGAMSADHGFWLGVSASIMMRAGMAASHGEARHKLTDMGSMRGFVYRVALKDFMGSRNTLGTAQWMFENLKWSSSYGGKAWARCTQSIIDLDAAILQLINQPSDEAVAKVVSALNVAVNQAHNGGWWLNKFIEKSWFDLASSQSLITLSVAAACMYKMKRTDLGSAVDELIAEWGKCSVIEAKPGGKLQVQLAKSSVDQTVYMGNAQKNAPADNYACSILELPEQFKDYTGAICPLCHTKYDFTEEETVGRTCSDQKSGVTCFSTLGWAENGECTTKYKIMGSSTSDDDDDPSEDDDDGEDYDEDEDLTPYVKPVPSFKNMPSGSHKSHDVSSWPPIKVNPGDNIAWKNINSSVPSFTTVQQAQCNFTINHDLKQVIGVHVQFTVDGVANKYLSRSVFVPSGYFKPSVAEAIYEGSETPLVSWSGSGVYNYWPLLVIHDVGFITLYQGQLDVRFRLDLKTGEFILG